MGSLKKPEPKQNKTINQNKPTPTLAKSFIGKVEPELDLIFMPSCEAHDRKLFLCQAKSVLHKEGRGQGLVVPTYPEKACSWLGFASRTTGKQNPKEL